MKKKGFTTVELVVSFALVITITVLLFQVVLNLKNLYVNSGIKTQLLNKQAIITNQINERLLEKKIDSYTSCGEDCLHFVYMDGTSEDLIINKQENYIEFADNRTYLIDKSNFGSIILDTYTTPVYQDFHNDSMLIINLPIYYNNDLKKDYGVRIVYQYNSKGSNIVPPDKPVQNDLAQTLLKDCSETNTVGLIRDTDGSCYYKGTKEEVSNNFVWFGGHLWRVLTINEDNTLTMITQQPITAIQPASSVWTTEQEYKDSYINHWLNSEEDGVFYKSLTQADKDKILNSTFNLGGEYNSTTSQVENIDSISTTQKVGLLVETQYIKMGGRNSFLDIKDQWWLGNRYGDSAPYMRFVFSSGSIDSSRPNSVAGVRAVIKISNLNFVDGKGTLDDPYREKSTTTSTANIKVGEYISVPTTGNDCGEDKRCLFRVVSKDNDSIKVILNGLLSTTSQFGSSEIYTSGNPIDTIVTTFANTLTDAYRYTKNMDFNIGKYYDGANYTAVQNMVYSGIAGLPVVGEMFTSNDIDLSQLKTDPKVFVNVDVVENPTVVSAYWTMNAYDTSNMRYINNDGRLAYNYNPTNAIGVRPVLFLNDNLTFASGEGTAEHPFTVE